MYIEAAVVFHDRTLQRHGRLCLGLEPRAIPHVERFYAIPRMSHSCSPPLPPQRFVKDDRLRAISLAKPERAARLRDGGRNP